MHEKNISHRKIMTYPVEMQLKKIVHDNWRFLVIISIASCIIRLLFFFTFTQYNDNAWMLFDSEQYLSIARNILNHNGYCITQGTPTFYRLPGYPFFLASGFALFSHSLWATLLFQLFLTCCIPVGIFLLACVLYPYSIIVAKHAAIIAAVHTGFIIYAGMIASESLCLVFLLLFFILFFYASRAHTEPVEVRILFFSGIFLGFASLMRPLGHYLLVLALVYLFFTDYCRSYPFDFARKSSLHSGRTASSHICYKLLNTVRPERNESFRTNVVERVRTALKNCIFLSLGWLIPLSPWLIRNFLFTGALFFHTLPGLHFLQFTASPVLATVNTTSYTQARKQLLDEWENRIRKKELETKKTLNEYEKCRLAEDIACSYAKQYPVQTVVHSGIQILKTCMALYSAQIILSDNKEWPDYYSKDQSAWSKIRRYFVPQVKTKWLIPCIYWEILLFLVIIMGCLFCFVSAGWQKNVLYMLGRTVPFASLLIFLTIAYGCARLRFPAEPFLIIWSSVGWQQMLKKLF